MSGLYRQVGVETSISGASPHQLVKLLIEGYFDSLAKARGGMRNKDQQAKAESISRALRIVDEGLKASLDQSSGGDIANNLYALYTYICVRLTQANLKNDESILDECQSLMEPIRDAWSRIEPASGERTQASSMEVRA